MYGLNTQISCNRRLWKLDKERGHMSGHFDELVDISQLSHKLERINNSSVSVMQKLLSIKNITTTSKCYHRRVGRLRQSWLRTVEDDLRPLSFSLATARRRTLDRSAWRLLVETATSTWHAHEREKFRHVYTSKVAAKKQDQILIKYDPQ